MSDIRFYDTCSLLITGENLFNTGEKFAISSITFNELEHIKTAANKDADVKYSARLLLHLLEKYPEQYDVVVHDESHETVITKQAFTLNDDLKILSDAIWYDTFRRPDEVIFVTNDLSLKHIANIFFGDGMIESVKEEADDYTGYKEVIASDEDMANFYQNMDYNHFNLYIGEYLIIKNLDGEIVDIRVWTGSTHRNITTRSFNSQWFGKVTPYNGDVYQKMLFDSLLNNKITMVKGPAGSGKTQVSLGFLMSELDKENISKIVIFCNTVATANSAKLGFYPGTKDEKLLDSQIGNLLISKFGGRDAVEQLIQSEKLVLLPLSDIRGYDTSGMRAGIYISEAQNLDRALIKLALQRIGNDSICIIDGDSRTQVDDIHFAGNNNGMRRVSKVYRGHDIYGEVELKTIYRSEIAKIAEDI